MAPIPGVPTWLHAQVIRLLGGAYFEGDICIISDIDMVPLSKAYFLESSREVPEDHFIVYRDGHDPQRFPMCYNAARGSVYKEMFSIRSIAEIPQKILEWAQRGLGWNTDELILTEYVKAWYAANGRVAFLGHQVTRRIDRLTWLVQGYWGYEAHQLRAGIYIDAHLLRSFTTYQRENLSILRDLGCSRQERIYIAKELGKQ